MANLSKTIAQIEKVLSLPYEAAGLTDAQKTQARNNIGAKGSDEPFADLLWQNASPTSQFNPQTVLVDLSDYPFVMVFARMSTMSGRYATMIMPKGYEMNFSLISGGSIGVVNAYRGATANNNGVVFGDCYRVIGSQPESVDNTCCIPHAIYGIR